MTSQFEINTFQTLRGLSNEQLYQLSQIQHSMLKTRQSHYDITRYLQIQMVISRILSNRLSFRARVYYPLWTPYVCSPKLSSEQTTDFCSWCQTYGMVFDGKCPMCLQLDSQLSEIVN